MRYDETPLHFECEGCDLIGILARPQRGATVGVVIVVGGPQYRVGSHRQFVLLSRALASEGVACLRFDYRGMGDSEGEALPFDATIPDIGAAVAALRREIPGLRSIVLWGLCDGASASAFAADDLQVNGLALFNPWVRSAQLQLETTVRHYYARRLMDRRFWMSLATGRVGIASAARNFVCATAGLLARRSPPSHGADLATRVGKAIATRPRPTLIALSENDQTAAEFRLASRATGALHDALQLSCVSCVDVREADHTFSTRVWRDSVASLTIAWIRNNFQVEGAIQPGRTDSVLHTTG
jgi:exosortase A-associated hydrolase 1